MWDNSTHKCSLVNGRLTETFRKCEDYNENVQKDICESIIPHYFNDSIEESSDLYYKCIFEDGLCKKKKKTCSDYLDFDDENECQLFISTDNSKRCAFYNGKCIEQYKKCEDYKDNVKKEICESIVPFNEEKKKRR